MFGVFQNPLSSIRNSPYLLEEVTESLVSTPEGRRCYFDFLTHHKDIHPIHKLYGLKAPSEQELSPSLISAHAKRLYLHIHPDKNLTEGYLTTLFQMVAAAKQAATKKEFSGLADYLDNPHVIVTLIKKNKWCQAKLLLAGNSQVGNPILDLLRTAVCLRLGDFEAATECVPSELTKVKALLETCREQLSPDFIVSDLDERISHLTSLLETFQGLTEMYLNEKRSGWPTPGYFDYATPHSLFVQLKECFKSKNDPLMYEKYLREAIRYCPDGIQSDSFNCEKKQLIAELKTHLERYYHRDNLLGIAFISEEMKRFAPLACKKMLSDFQNTSLAEVHKERIASLVDGFCSKDKITYLNRLIHALDGLSEQTTLTSVVSFINLFSPQISQKVDKYCGQSAQTKDTLDLWLPRLRAWAYYLENDKERAAHYFLQGRDYRNLGCTLVEIGCFAEALAHWNSKAAEEAMPHVFAVMNFCDTLSLPESAAYEREWLGCVDDAQLRVLSHYAHESVGL